MLKRLWDEYFADEDAVIKSDEEKEILGRILEMQDALIKIITNEQNEAVERYVDALLELQCVALRKAFIKGCRFSVSFLMDVLSNK